MTATRITLGSINVEAADPEAPARFRATVTGGVPTSAGDLVHLPEAGPGGFAMFFQPLTGQRPTRHSIHLDLTVPWGRDGRRSSGLRRLARPGAGTSWTSTRTCSGRR